MQHFYDNISVNGSVTTSGDLNLSTGSLYKINGVEHTHSNYVTSAAIANYATSASLNNYETSEAHNTSLSNYATSASLSSYALVASLENYATSASLSQYETSAAHNASIANYATSASLSSYALVASLENYETSAAHNASIANYATSAHVHPIASSVVNGFMPAVTSGLCYIDANNNIVYSSSIPYNLSIISNNKSPALSVWNQSDTSASASYIDINTSSSAQSYSRLAIGSDYAALQIHCWSSVYSGSYCGVNRGGMTSIRTTNTSGTGDFLISTNTGNDLILGTNNLDRVHITSAGMIGMGIVAPIADLHIQKSVPDGAVNFIIRNSSTTGHSTVVLGSSSGNTNGLAAYGSAYYPTCLAERASAVTITAGYGGGLIFNAQHATGIITFHTGAYYLQRMSVSAGGLVGIGRDAVTDILEVQGTVNAITSYKCNSLQVLGPPVTSWGAVPTGNLVRTTFVSDSVTLVELAKRVAALIVDLRTHGLIRGT